MHADRRRRLCASLDAATTRPGVDLSTLRVGRLGRRAQSRSVRGPSIGSAASTAIGRIGRTSLGA